MTPAINRPLQEKAFSFDEFLARYGGDRRYELIDGEVLKRLRPQIRRLRRFGHS
jgi:hypothetical protein